MPITANVLLGYRDGKGTHPWRRDIWDVGLQAFLGLAVGFARSRGVDLVRVEYIPDDTADIAASVLRLKDRVGPGGFVFTSGGIGATHDDVTYEAIAAAFGEHASSSWRLPNCCASGTYPSL